MAQPGVSASEPSPSVQSHPPTPPSGTQNFLRKLFGRQNGGTQPSSAESTQDQDQQADPTEPEKPGLIRRMSRKVVPGLPRAQTFKRQQSERRDNLSPVKPSSKERRAVSVDRRSRRLSSIAGSHANPRISAPSFLGSTQDERTSFVAPLPAGSVDEQPVGPRVDSVMGKDDELTLADECAIQDTFSTADTQSITTSQYDAMIRDELEKTWILNLSMHFRDRSKREKFFVTYREEEHLWRRVTISLDYRDPPMNSLEMDLIHTHYQREKSAKIYEAIRESLRDIQFYETVTNLKLQTTDGRLHVHVVEDGNEVIQYPSISQVQHLACRRIRERDIMFDSHMSGFVYKVKVNGRTLIKKEIPSPETIDEFLYEVNALSRLRDSHNVIHFYGVVVDDQDEHVKGLLIDYAEDGALVDIIYERCKENNEDIPWSTRQKWARQIVQGLSDIHESGFVQGDFTLSNIVIDKNNDAKIIDINRRGCPVGWEPPEATPLIECNQRISMYIGVKSDLYQLGMVLWAIAMQEDDPETQGRPLILGPEVNIPDWYRQMAEICLSDDPRMRLHASTLLQMFPHGQHRINETARLNPPPSTDADGEYSLQLQQFLAQPQIRTVEPASDWSYVSRPYTDASPGGYEQPYYFSRGRSPPSSLPSRYGRCDSPRGMYDDIAAWAANRDIPSSYSDVGVDDIQVDETPIAERGDLIGVDTICPADSSEDGIEKELSMADLTGPSTGESGFEQDEVDSCTTPPCCPRETDELLEMTAVEKIEGEETPRATETVGSGLADIDHFDPVTQDNGLSDESAETSKLMTKETIEAQDGTPTPRLDMTGAQASTVEQSESLDASPPTEEHEKELPGTLPTSDKETEVQEMEQQKSGHELKATQLPGTTEPNAQAQATTELSSKTVTPPSTCGYVEEKRTTENERSPSDEKLKEVRVESESTNVVAENEPEEASDTLNGVGTAHLTNHDDMMRQIQTIDEALDEVQSSAEPPPITNLTDAKT